MLMDDLKTAQTRREALQRLSDRRCELLERISAPSSPSYHAAPIRVNDPHDLSDDFARIDEIERKYEAAFGAYCQTVERCYDGFAELDLPTRAAVLLAYRYIIGLKWEEISGRMELTPQRLHQIYRKAVAEITAKEKTRS